MFVYRILAIDPGREKCGVAVVDGQGAIVFHSIRTRGEVVSSIKSLLKEHGLAQVVIGHATGFRQLEEELKAALPGLKIAHINETGSTLEARGVYWHENPPRGWRRMMPLSLQTPPGPIDDYAAVVLARRFLESEGADK